MELVGDKERLANFLASQDAPALAQVLLELAEDFPPVYARLERLKVRDDPAALSAQFSLRLEDWRTGGSTTALSGTRTPLRLAGTSLCG